MNLHVLPAGPIETNAYLLTEPVLGAAVLVDAPDQIWEEIEPILDQQQCSLQELWLTHGHWDHLQGAAQVIRATGARVRAHPDDRAMIENPAEVARFLGGQIKLDPVKVDLWLEPGERIGILDTWVEIRHVPGHCPGNVLFYFQKLGFAIVGDALFKGAVGRTDLPGGSFSQLERSIREQIYTLPENTVVFPGHGPKTSVADEKANNPYVRA